MADSAQPLEDAAPAGATGVVRVKTPAFHRGPWAKRIVERLAAGLGLEVVPLWRKEKLPQARYLRQLLSLAEIDCVFDVGANAGQYRDFLREHSGYGGWIASFEPIPDLAALLRERARADARWLVFDCALGSSSGRSILNVTRDTQFSSFLAPREDAGRKFVGLGTLDRSVAVEVRTLDEAFGEVREATRFRRAYLKLDTQGFDLEVVAGARNCLSGFVAMQLEASMTPIYDRMPSYADAIERMRSLGFDPSAIFPNNPDHFPELVEFDCHLVNAREVASLRRRYLAEGKD